MNENSCLLGQALLQYSSSGILLVLLHQCVDSLLVKTCEYLDISLGVIVADVEPELVELVWCGTLGIEPDVTAFGFTEFLSVGLGDERAGESVCLHVVAECASDEFSTCGHIAPLVVAAQL